MTLQERRKYFLFLGLRSFVALFDLAGILAIGFLATSIALFITLGSDPNRVVEFAGLALPAATAQSLPVFSTIVLGLFLVKAISSILLSRQLAYFLARIEARAAKTVAERAFGRGLADARQYTKEEIYFAVQAGSPAAFNSILNSVGVIVAEGLLFILVIGAFLSIDIAAAFAALAYFGFVALFIQLFLGKLMENAAVRSAKGTVDANTAIGDLSEVLREATTLGKKDFFLDRIYEARTRTASSTASQLFMGGMPRHIVETSLIAAIAIFALWQLVSGDIVKAAGTLGIFLSGGLRLTASLLPLQSSLLNLKQSVPIADKAIRFLDQGPDSPEDTKLGFNVYLDQQPSASILAEQVDFRYPNSETDAISDFSFVIDKGKQVAFIGPSGGGKSTVADLILGLLTPSSGTVLVDGKSPREIISESPGRLAYVPQRPGIVSGTISDNIALGLAKDEVDHKRLEESIRLAHLADLISTLPDGINTSLGKRKDELSGGQLQRIGLARALYTSPGLIVMDEATSSLDANSENEINKALDEMRGRVTVILIAHRLNTVQRSDVVFFVEKGRITASGNFQELVAINKDVSNLVNLMAVDHPQQ
jgi:ATP-binding cassette subfamily C protein